MGDTTTYYAVADSETVHTDPNCRNTLIGPSCATTTVWSEVVIYRNENGQAREITHQSCMGQSCNAIEALVVDGASVFTIGTVSKRIPMNP